ncbi:MAG: tRNA glutamyl-Q(34) synthetase GluQRS [Alphaproteobacteria bacterium]|nr:tRNA glutamyl-Q(34) synthetase GluQRS [Alphaproteobacteria bacterium]
MAGIVTRFAPSPTGPLHLGSAFAALFAERAAREAGGMFLLRIEDLDFTRCRPEHEAAILEDLAWLGIAWDGPVRRQSEHLSDFAQALERLHGQGVVYPCFCTRGDVLRAATAPHGPEGPVYPGTCRHLDAATREARIAAGHGHAFRLDLARALALTGPLGWTDRDAGPQTARPELFGDIVVARRDIGTSYHVAVVVDDALQGVTLVTRGEDLFAATHVQRVLQALLGLAPPAYHHHRLILDDAGQRLAKRAPSATLGGLRATGQTPAQVRACLGFA